MKDVKNLLIRVSVETKSFGIGVNARILRTVLPT